jgi:hypothetical protein
MNGVNLNSIEVVSAEHGETKVNVSLSILADNEFEAVGWLVSVLNVDA